MDEHTACPFAGKDGEDVLLKVSKMVEDHIRKRDLTYTDVTKYADAFSDMLRATVATHVVNCDLVRRVEENSRLVREHIVRMGAEKDAIAAALDKKAKKTSTNASLAKMIAEIAVTAIAILSFFLTIQNATKQSVLEALYNKSVIEVPVSESHDLPHIEDVK